MPLQIDFQQIFNAAPQTQASAPGRVNLLGEHTDYNDGFVLPVAIPQQTTVYLGFSPNDRHHGYSATLQEWGHWMEEPAATRFGRYVFGCIRVLEKIGHTIPPLNILITSSVPIGAGLSSSAALEVATLRGLRSLLNLELDDVQIAKLGQQAEIEYAGVRCGIMDQMAASLADTTHLLFLDARTLDCQRLPLPVGTEILVVDSGIPRTLATSGYNQRRSECEAAARLLGVKALRDITTLDRVKELPEPLRRRARHVISENNRVLQVLDLEVNSAAAEAFGSLMNASHASLQQDYEVSVAGLDRLVNLLQKTPGVFGARLTGAGFGGACVALVAAGRAEAIGQTVLRHYGDIGYSGRILVAGVVQA